MFLVKKKKLTKSYILRGGGGQGQFGKSLHFDFFYGFPKGPWNIMLYTKHSQPNFIYEIRLTTLLSRGARQGTTQDLGSYVINRLY